MLVEVQGGADDLWQPWTQLNLLPLPLAYKLFTALSNISNMHFRDIYGRQFVVYLEWMALPGHQSLSLDHPAAHLVRYPTMSLQPYTEFASS